MLVIPSFPDRTGTTSILLAVCCFATEKKKSHISTNLAILVVHITSLARVVSSHGNIRVITGTEVST